MFTLSQLIIAVGLAQTPLSVQAFYNDFSYDTATQKQVEQNFQNASGPLNFCGFDPSSTAGACGTIGCSVSGPDFSVQIVGGCVKLLAPSPGPDLVPDSMPYALFGTDGPPSTEWMRVTFPHPRREVGLWIIDSEINETQSNGQKIDKIRFIGASGATLFEHDLPGIAYPGLADNPNQFFGVISSDPIARIEIDEQGDTEEVGIDSLQFSPDTPSCDGTFGQYGTGCPGEFGQSPRLTVSGCLSVGDNYKISVANGAPSNAIAQILVGGSSANPPVHVRYGCFLLVDVSPMVPYLIPLAIPLSALENGITTQVPTGLQNFTITMQAFVPPPPGLPKFSATNAIELHFP